MPVMRIRSSRLATAGLALCICLLLTVTACNQSATPMSPSSSSAPSSVTATQALTSVIRGLDAAIYGYGIVGSHLSGSEQKKAKKAMTTLNRQRLSFMLVVGAQVNPEAVAYQIPFPVTDSNSAKRLAALLEITLIPLFTTAAQATTGPVQTAALLAKTKAAARAAIWAGTPTAPVPTTSTPN